MRTILKFCAEQVTSNQNELRIKDFLKNRLHLETSEEKSKVINLKKNSSEFLGFSIKAVRKGKTRFGYVAKSNMSKKGKSKCL